MPHTTVSHEGGGPDLEEAQTALHLKKPKLHYTFHNPNTPEATADFLVKLFIEVNQPKVEQMIYQAQEAALDSPSESSSATPT